MKFIIVFVLSLLHLINCNLPNANVNTAVNNEQFLLKFKKSIENIKLAQTTNSKESDDVKYFWDLWAPLHRYLLLNQTKIHQAKWNITEKLVANSNSLNWDSMPSNVKSILSDQFNGLKFLDLTYAELGWVKANEKYADTKLASLLPPHVSSQLASISSILSQLNLEQKYDYSLLKTMDLDEIHINLGLNYLPLPPIVFESMSSKVNEWSILDSSIYTALVFLKNHVNQKLVF